MLAGLIEDLNARTRWTGLSISSDPTVTGAAMAAAWMTGLPIRASFGRGRAEQDPWRCEARRMVESGEADALVWISAFGEPPPHWAEAVPTVVVADQSVHANGATTLLRVGRPGVDHAGVLHDRVVGALSEVAPESPSVAPSVADALTRIAAALDAR
jgi:formylmethanofuran dehydrogenase subunit B